MSSSDAESLRAYMEALISLMMFPVSLEGLTLEEQTFLADYLRQRHADLHMAIRERRSPALVAGVNAGATYRHMRNLLQSCAKLCNKIKLTSESEAQANPHLLAKRFFPHITELLDLISLAESKTPIVVDQNLKRTDEAVLSIIKSQPKGKGIDGRGIIRRLAAQSIELEESSLRRHVLPRLVKNHGVVNHRAAGGYLVP